MKNKHRLERLEKQLTKKNSKRLVIPLASMYGDDIKPYYTKDPINGVEDMFINGVLDECPYQRCN